MTNWSAIVFLFLPELLFGQFSSYKYYSEDSTISCEIIQLDSVDDAHRHIVYYHENGQKANEFFDRNRVPYDTLFRWNELGEVTHMEIYSDSGYIQFDYYPNGKMRELGSWKFTEPQSFDLIIYDSLNWNKYVAEDCKHPCFQKTGIWKTYYQNGQLKSQWEYLPMAFGISYPTEADSNGIAHIIPKTGFEMIPGVIYMGGVTYLRDGKWLIYTEDGEIENEIEYIGGLPTTQ